MHRRHKGAYRLRIHKDSQASSRPRLHTAACKERGAQGDTGVRDALGGIHTDAWRTRGEHGRISGEGLSPQGGIRMHRRACSQGGPNAKRTALTQSRQGRRKRRGRAGEGSPSAAPPSP